jgi:hypothetical protein
MPTMSKMFADFLYHHQTKTMDKLRQLRTLLNQPDTLQTKKFDTQIEELEKQKRDIETQLDEFKKSRALEEKNEKLNSQWRKTIDFEKLLKCQFNGLDYVEFFIMDQTEHITIILSQLGIQYQTDLPRYVVKEVEERSMLCVHPPRYHTVRETYAVYGDLRKKTDRQDLVAVIIKP